MPNPTDLSQVSGSVKVSAVAASVTLSDENTWQIHHTGVGENGLAATDAVFCRFNDSAGVVGAATRNLVVPPGCALCLPKRTSRVVLLTAPGAASSPMVNLICQKDSVQ